MKIVHILVFTVCLSATIYAQDETQKVENSIKNQFQEVLDTSNDFQDFKVIKKTKMTALQSNVLDSITKLEEALISKQLQINEQQSTIKTLENNLNATKENLEVSKDKEDGIVFLGMLLNKNTYNTLMFSIIGLLLVALLFYIYKFNNSNKVTKESKEKLEGIETEFERFRQKKLEDEQILRRKLQDEINKNK